MSSTLDSESDVNVGELVGTNGEDGLVNLVSEERTGGGGETRIRGQKKTASLFRWETDMRHVTHGSTMEMGDPLSRIKPLPGVT